MGVISFFSKSFSPAAIYEYHKRCIDNFGIKFMSLMTTNYFITNGFYSAFIGEMQFPYYQDIGYTSDQTQLNETISAIPASLKGLFGVISDSFPLFGFHKASYMFLTAILATIALTLLVAIPDSALKGAFLELPALIIMFCYIQTQFSDLMTQGKFVELMIKTPASKGDLVTYSWFYQIFGGIFPFIFIGPLGDTDSFNMKYLFILGIPLAIHPVIPLSLGCMPNDKVAPHLANKINFTKVKAHGKIFFMAVSIAFCAILSVVLSVLTGETVNFIYSICAALALMALLFFCMPVTVAKATLYIVLCDMVYLNMSGPFNYWFTADEECVPGGPHFSLTFYISVIGILKAVCNCLGVILFQTIVCKWKLRYIYWCTTLIRVTASLFDIVIIQRWNLAIGIPDTIMFIFGNTIIYQTVYMMDFMPSNLLIAKLCPKSIEATVFSIIAGFANYGVALGGFIGVFIQRALNVYGSKESGCNYDNFIWLILICNFIGPIVNIVNTFWLIPNVKITEDFVADHYEKAKLNPKSLEKVPDYVKDAEAAKMTYQ